MYLRHRDDTLSIEADSLTEQTQILEHGLIVVPSAEGKIERRGMLKSADTAES